MSIPTERDDDNSTCVRIQKRNSKNNTNKTNVPADERAQ